MKLFMGALVLVAVALGVGACETIKGVGRDIEKTGEMLDKAL